MNLNQNLTGIWKANLEKSKLLGPAPQAVTAKIRHSDADLAVAMVITMPDRTEHRLIFGGPTTGEEVLNTVNGQLWRSQIRWIGTELLIESWVDLGQRKCHFRDFWFLSDNGQSLTMEHRDDDLGGQVTLLEKTSQQSI